MQVLPARATRWRLLRARAAQEDLPPPRLWGLEIITTLAQGLASRGTCSATVRHRYAPVLASLTRARCTIRFPIHAGIPPITPWIKFLIISSVMSTRWFTAPWVEEARHSWDRHRLHSIPAPGRKQRGIVLGGTPPIPILPGSRRSFSLRGFVIPTWRTGFWEYRGKHATN